MFSRIIRYFYITDEGNRIGGEGGGPGYPGAIPKDTGERGGGAAPGGSPAGLAAHRL